MPLVPGTWNESRIREAWETLGMGPGGDTMLDPLITDPLPPHQRDEEDGGEGPRNRAKRDFISEGGGL